MRLDDGQFQCDDCGAILDVPHDAELLRVIVAATEPIRVLALEERAVHTCELRYQPDLA
jgi:hypothetical protein